MNIYLLGISLFIGYLIAKYISGKKTGQQGKIKSLKFVLKKYTIHIHHWIWALAILIGLDHANFYNNYTHGILIGVIIQGLTYKDFYKIVYKNSNSK